MDIKRADVNTEKHVPFIEEIESGYRVTIGKPGLHPMSEEHHIVYAEVIINGEVVRRHDFEVGDEPIIEFEMDKFDEVIVREYCNIHGLWENKLSK